MTHGRVGGDLAATPVRQVAAGVSFTIAVTLDGKVYQMGETGASVRAKWEGAKTPELVMLLRTALQTLCKLLGRCCCSTELRFVQCTVAALAQQLHLITINSGALCSP